MKYRDIYLTRDYIPVNEDGTLFDRPAVKRRREILQGKCVLDCAYSISRTVDGKVVVWQPYVRWRSMLNRVYEPGLKSRHPTYNEVTLCDEWHVFSNFLVWYLDQRFISRGFELDKDVLTDSKKYGPDTCVLVPSSLNSFLVTPTKDTDLPAGVSFHCTKGKFQAEVRNSFTGKEKHLGYFDDAESARCAWAAEKTILAEAHKAEWDEVDARLFYRVLEKIRRNV